MKIVPLLCATSLALLFALPSNAAPQAEATMLVSGTVHIASNGGVTSYSLDQPEKLPGAVKKAIAKTVATWIFEPILADGKRVSGVSDMYLRLVAKQLPHDKYAISVHGERFGQPGNDYGVAYGHKRRIHPNYPAVARRAAMGGTVFLAARVNRQGKVVKVAVEQVNLDSFSTPTEMKRCREAFARASEKAIKRWIFDLPTKGPKVAADHWDVRIPIKFSLAPFGVHAPAARYGTWRAYVPGPHNKIAWLDHNQVPTNSIDVMPKGSLAAAGQSRHLLTPLAGGG